MKHYNAANVSEFIDLASDESKPHLNTLREIMLSSSPNIEEKISWGIPFYKKKGYIAGFTYFKNHVGFGFSIRLDDEIKSKLDKMGYDYGAKTIQIRYNQEIPIELIKSIVKKRLEEDKAD